MSARNDKMRGPIQYSMLSNGAIKTEHEYTTTKLFLYEGPKNSKNYMTNSALVATNLIPRTTF